MADTTVDTTSVDVTDTETTDTSTGTVDDVIATTTGEILETITRDYGDLVTSFYVSALGRVPDHGGYNYWVEQIASKGWADAISFLSNGFAESQEYKSIYADSTTVLESIYTNAGVAYVEGETVDTLASFIEQYYGEIVNVGEETAFDAKVSVAKFLQDPANIGDLSESIINLILKQIDALPTFDLSLDNLSQLTAMLVSFSNGFINATEIADGLTISGFAPLGSQKVIVTLPGDTEGREVIFAEDGTSWTLDLSGEELAAILQAAAEASLEDGVDATDSGVVLPTITGFDYTVLITDADGKEVSINNTVSVDVDPPAAPEFVISKDGDVYVVSGTADVDSIVTLTFADGETTAEVTVNEDGSWVYELQETDITAGINKITATAADTAGNSAETIVENPIFAIAGDNIINIAEKKAGVVIEGLGEAGSEIILTFGDRTETVTVDENGSWSYELQSADYPATKTGNLTFQVNGVETTVEVDLKALNKPKISVVTEDGIIDQTEIDGGEIVISGTFGRGTFEPGSKIQLQFLAVAEDGTKEKVDATGDVTVNEDGTWTYALTEEDLAYQQTDANGKTTLKVFARSEDVNGNLSLQSASKTITISHLFEHDPSINIENKDDFTISGRATVDTTSVTLDFGNDKVVTIEVDADGMWEYTLLPEDYSNVEGGNLTIIATAKEGEKTVAVDTIANIPVDTVAPEAAIVSDHDLINVAGSEEAIISGTAEAGSTIILNFGGEEDREVTADENGNWTYTLEGGNSDYTEISGDYANLDSNVDDNGNDIDVLNVTVTVKDKAGNLSEPVSKEITVDFTPPEDPTIDSYPEIISPNVLAETPEDFILKGTFDTEAGFALYVGGELVEPETNANTGEWTYTLINADYAGVEGDLEIKTVATDSAGNTSELIQNIVTDFASSVDVSTTSISRAEKEAGASLTGKTDSDSTVTLTFADNTTANVTANENGVWSYTLTENNYGTIVDDQLVVTISAEDVNGNVATVKANIAVDLVAPDAPIFDVVAENDVINAADKEAGVVITGTAEVDSIVTLTFADGTTANAENVDGVWSYTLDSALLVDGEFTLTATATDKAGNVSDAAETTVVVDVTAPEAPTFDAIAEDDVINAAEKEAGVVITGTAEAGSIVTLTFADGSTADAENVDGVWSYALTNADYEVNLNSITATATDEAGNVSVESDVKTITVDTEVTNFTSVIDSSIDLTERADGVTISGTVEEGSSVSLTFGGNEAVGAIVDGNTWTYTLTEDDYPTEGLELTINVVATDVAGNISEDSKTVTLSSVTTLPVVDANSGDTISFGGKAIAGQAIVIHIGDLTFEVPAENVDENGNWTLEVAKTDLTEEGELSFKVVSTDESGTETIWAEDSLIVDTVAPNAPTFDAIADDNVINAADKEAGVVITGTAEAGSTVTLTFADGTTVDAENVDGVWSYTLDSALLVDGELTLTATATDLAGNESESTSTSVTVDLVAPDAPAVNTIEDVINVAAKEEGVTVTGTSEADAIVTLTFADGTTTAQVTADAEGAWSYDLTNADYEAGLDTITVTATDVAGNESESTTTSISINLVVPNAPTFDVIAEDDAINAAEKEAGVVITGTAEVDSTVTLTFADGTTADVENVDGIWSYTLDAETIVDGELTFIATATNAAGNVSESAETTVAIDVTAPEAPIIDAIEGVINAEGAEITGTAEVDSVVTLTFSDGTTTDVENVDGVWSYALTTEQLVDGELTLTAVATDAAGNVSESAETTVVIDVTAPEAPVIDAIENVLNAEDVATGVAVTGTAEAGATVTLTFANTSTSGEVVADENGTWSYTLTAEEYSAEVDSIVVEATATDAAGNVSEVSEATTIIFDTIAPNAPTFDAVSNDDVINAAEKDAEEGVVVSGTAETGSTVTLTFADGTTAEAENVDGVWSYTLDDATLVDGSEVTFTATATDVAGNISVISEAKTIAVDLISDAPVFDAVSEDDVINAADKDAGVAITGTAEAGSTIALNFADGSSNLEAITADADGVWSYTLTGANYETAVESVLTVTAIATDEAGNVSESTELNVTIDTDAPSAPAFDVVSEDDMINALEQEEGVVLSGTAEADSIITLTFADGIATGEAVTDSEGVWSYDVTEEDYTAGLNFITATATDLAGNVSVASTEKVITVDLEVSDLTVNEIAGNNVIDLTERTAGAVISGTVEAGSSVSLVFGENEAVGAIVDGDTWTYTLTEEDYPVSGRDLEVTVIATDKAGNSFEESTSATLNYSVELPVVNTTSEDTISFGGRAIAGQAIVIHLGDLTFEVPVENVDDNGNWTLDIAKTDLPEGELSFQVISTDENGTETTWAEDTLLVDITAPNAPTFDAVSDDNVINAEEKDAEVVVTGTAEVGSTVTLTFADESTVAFENVDGTWSYTFDSALLVDGDVTFTATATDVAGNVSASSETTITVDSVAPDAATFDAVAEDNIINAAEKDAEAGVKVSGTAEAGSTVTLTFEDATTTASAVTNAEGVWSYTLNDSDYVAGLGTITATVTDVAGNVSDSSETAVTIDVDAPEAPNFNTIAEDDVINAAEKDAGVVVTGTAEADATVLLTFADNSTAEVTSDSEGNWTYDLTDDNYATADEENVLTITATAKDAAGNVSASSSSASITLNLVVPAIPEVNAIAENEIINAAEKDEGFAISGTADADTTIVLTFADDSIAETTSDANGEWSYDLNDENYATADADGKVTFTVAAKNEAGNTSEAVSGSVNIDFDVPEVPVINAVAEDDVIDATEQNAGVSVSGTAEADSFITLTFADATPVETTADAEGNWSYQLTATEYATVVDSELKFTATATDAAGNVSDISDERVVTIEAVPTYSIEVDKEEVAEGNTAIFTLTTTNLVEGTQVPFTLGGTVEDADVEGGLPTTTNSFFIVGEGGTSTLEIQLLDDDVADGDKDLTVTLVDENGDNLVDENGQAFSATTLVTDINTDPTYELVVDSENAVEGDTITFTLSTTNVDPDTVIDLTFGGSITAADIDGELPTSITVGDDGTAEFSVDLLLDGVFDGSETLTVTAEGATATSTVTDAAATYALSVDSASIEEGDTVTFTLETTDVADGTQVPFTIGGDVASNDVVSGNLFFTVTGNQATLDVTVASDDATETDEDLTITLTGVTDSDGNAVSATTTVTDVAVSSGIALNAGDNLTATADKDTYLYEVTYDATNGTIVGLDGNVSITGFDPTVDVIELVTASGATALTDAALTAWEATQVENGSISLGLAAFNVPTTIEFDADAQDVAATITLVGAEDYNFTI